MLGTDRPSVTLALGELQKEDQAIQCRRGAVQILNHRKRLQAAVCECYRVIEQFERPAWSKIASPKCSTSYRQLLLPAASLALSQSKEWDFQPTLHVRVRIRGTRRIPRGYRFETRSSSPSQRLKSGVVHPLLATVSVPAAHHSSSAHTKVRVCLFPKLRIDFSACRDHRRQNRGSWHGRQRRSRRCGISGWPHNIAVAPVGANFR